MIASQLLSVHEAHDASSPFPQSHRCSAWQSCRSSIAVVCDCYRLALLDGMVAEGEGGLVSPETLTMVLAVIACRRSLVSRQGVARCYPPAILSIPSLRRHRHSDWPAMRAVSTYRYGWSCIDMNSGVCQLRQLVAGIMLRRAPPGSPSGKPSSS